ncbi:hypothetical protein LX32DRAFT_698537 [Colletotrichum zoysiae]|uniref:Uncharacterized protein n=1 Tax=Colletotrichum zoysiae TaxID=1216348 RepID=A0AAD9LUJ4_9PEZI|nr:hypothetical protein LX32DRAFT_698537 [Colletotrichum zoysiae]
MPCAVFSCRPSSSFASLDIPAIAYVDRDSLRNDRAASLNHILQPPPKRRPSKPTASLYRTYLNRINPQDPARDPSVVALLFALAQSQRRKLGRARGSAAANPISFQVHVLLGDVLDDTRLWVYTADIPIAALDRLADFRCTPRGATHFTIHTTEIPFQPYTTLPERLLRATLPKVAQIFQAPPDRKRPRASDTSPAERMKIARVG